MFYGWQNCLAETWSCTIHHDEWVFQEGHIFLILSDQSKDGDDLHSCQCRLSHLIKKLQTSENFLCLTTVGMGMVGKDKIVLNTFIQIVELTNSLDEIVNNHRCNVRIKEEILLFSVLECMVNSIFIRKMLVECKSIFIFWLGNDEHKHEISGKSLITDFRYWHKSFFFGFNFCMKVK